LHDADRLKALEQIRARGQADGRRTLRGGLDDNSFAALNQRIMRVETEVLHGRLEGAIADALGEALPPLIREQLKAQLPGLLAKAAEVILRPIETRLKALEEKQITFRGPHKDGALYQAGDLTIRQGGLWFCRKATVAPPGTAPEDWTLAVKRGSVDRGQP
jgi:hypothetical protein